MRCCEDLLNESQHIDNVINVRTSVEILKNRLRLKTFIDAITIVLATCLENGMVCKH